MLYKSSLNGITYDSKDGFRTIIYNNGTVKVNKKGGLLEFNYINIQSFEEALADGECPVYHIHSFEGAMQAIRDNLVHKDII